MKKTFLILGSVLTLALVFGTSCRRDKTQTALEYMPNMYRGPAFEAYTSNPNFSDGLSARKPVEGTIAKGYIPYEFSNSQVGYDSARVYLKSSWEGRSLTTEEMEVLMQESKELYTIFCSHCHGEKGDGNGILVQREKILGVPSYSTERLPDITEGSIYHVIMHGKGIMGSHASQLNYDERWKIVQYVLKLRSEISPKTETVVVEEQTNPEV
jgi:mono/diheme cytochrome c family protein